MEIMVPSNNDFIFDSAQSTPFASAPSSPKPFGGAGGGPFDYYHHYTSAPTSPSRVAAILASSSSPFGWEEKKPRATPPRAHNPDDFAFDFGGGQLEKGTGDLTAADELFEKGKIRPLKPPPPRAYNEKKGGDTASLPRSPGSPQPPRRGLRPHHRGGDKGVVDPFAAAMVKASTQERGRERSSASRASSTSYSASSAPSRSRKGSRSLSPMRSQLGTAAGAAAPTTIGAECLKNNSGGSKKWRLRDLLLFRSASEGRVTGNKSKDPLRKYTIMSSSSSSLFSKKGGEEDSRSSSFRSTESNGATSTRRSSVSAHEMHYKSKRAAAEEMKKKTALPFNRHGLFGCLGFNPAVNSIAKSFHNGYSFDRRQ